MATYTFTLRPGITLSDAKTPSGFDIDDALASGSGTITTTDDALAAQLRSTLVWNGSANVTLLIEGGVTPGAPPPDRRSNVPVFVQGDEPTQKPYVWEKTDGAANPTGVRIYHDGTSAHVVGSTGQTPTAVKTAAYTAVAGDTVRVNSALAQVTVTLPASAPVGATVEIKETGNNPKGAIVMPAGSDTIDGLASITLPTFQYTARTLRRAPSNDWTVASGLTPTLQVTSSVDAYVITGLVGDGSTDDATRINQALADTTHPVVALPPGKTYGIGAALGGASLPNARTFRANGATVLALVDNINMFATPAVNLDNSGVQQAGGGGRCADLTVEGGIWDRGNHSGSGNRLHSLVFYKADRFRCRNITYKSTSGKYGIYGVDLTNFNFEHTKFAGAASDGLHLGGSCRRGMVVDTSGTTNDDLAVLLGKDNPAYLFGDEGDCYDVIFDGILAEGCDTNAFKILGGNGLTVRGIIGRNITGYMTGSARTQAGVWVGDDAAYSQMVGGQLEAITIEDVYLNLNKASISLIKANMSTALDVLTLRNLKISTGDSLGRIVQVLGILNTLELDGASGLPGTITDGHVVQVADGVTSAVLRRVIARRLNVIWPSVSGALVAARTAGHTLEDVILSDSACKNVFSAVDTAAATRAKLSNVRMDSATNSFNIRATGSIIADVTNADLGGTLAVTAGGTARSRQFGFRCDVSRLTKTAGDMAYNTNSGLSCGVGPVVCDGTNWKHLFTAATY